MLEGNNLGVPLMADHSNDPYYIFREYVCLYLIAQTTDHFYYYHSEVQDSISRLKLDFERWSDLLKNTNTSEDVAFQRQNAGIRIIIPALIEFILNGALLFSSDEVPKFCTKAVK